MGLDFKFGFRFWVFRHFVRSDPLPFLLGAGAKMSWKLAIIKTWIMLDIRRPDECKISDASFQSQLVLIHTNFSLFLSLMRAQVQAEHTAPAAESQGSTPRRQPCNRPRPCTAPPLPVAVAADRSTRGRAPPPSAPPAPACRHAAPPCSPRSGRRCRSSRAWPRPLTEGTPSWRNLSVYPFQWTRERAQT